MARDKTIRNLDGVKVFKRKLNRDTNKWEKVPDGFATFHQWGCDYQELEAGTGNFSTAIIERDDGKVEMVVADMIQFIG